ncbi:uncharacterized protein BYT42DRAFT_611301 [Radiomyces spectabilis]|uniref:uncharacterized protein n=1 Tax=Radiomyces spectabilis TaxID=64574 RepID=UPI00221F2DEC|nr:uncharacterized protein BYT42DRAFT_611301 [Radiomyces spectabilis]KAI8388231.1 hypothetical protein BYT42DRAFT_611301 [Radiomyces spectabilis]
MSQAIFVDVISQLDSALSRPRREYLAQLLRDNGATCIDSEPTDDDSSTESPIAPTHIVSMRAPSVVRTTELQKRAVVVSPQWVEAAVKNGFKHRPEFYSTDPLKFFSGIVVTTSGLPTADREAIYGGVMALGGQFREDLTQDVTHLACLAPQGKKYEEAIKRRNIIKTVLPHWFDDCFKFKRLVREDVYLFPDPPLMRTIKASRTDDVEEPTGDKVPERTKEDKLIYVHPTADALPTTEPKEKYLADRCFFFAADLKLKDELLPKIESCLIKAGATVESTFSDKVNIVIAKYRSSPECIKACQEHKLVASLWWIFNTLARQRFELPTRTLLDYPQPKGGIPGMENMVITVSTYTGIARVILRTLIQAVGATFTPSLSERNTHVIAGSKASMKYQKAFEKNLPIVNHLWLEECFQKWCVKTPVDERYVMFPGGHILDDLVGKTPLLPEDMERWWRDPENAPATIPFAPKPVALSPAKSHKELGSPVETGEETSRSPSPTALVPGSTKEGSSVSPTPMDEKRHPKRNLGDENPEAEVAKRQRIASQEEIQEKEAEAVPEEASEPPAMEEADETSPASPMEEIMEQPASAEKSDEDMTDAESEQKEETQSSPPSPPATKSRSRTPTSRETDHPPSTAPSSQASTAKSKHGNTIKIATSNVTLSSDDKSAIRRLGGGTTENILQATHLVVEKRILRTPKFLCAVNLGLSIVRLEWLKDSISQEQWQNESEYEVHDSDVEKRLGFNLAKSLDIARKHQVEYKSGTRGTWLEGYEICILQTNKNAVKDVIETAGGKVVPKPSARRLRDLLSGSTQTRLLVVSTAQDKDKWTEYSLHNVPVYDTEIIIAGAFRQRLDFDEFRLA